MNFSKSAILISAVLAVSAIGCSKRQIIQEANPHLDPFPVAVTPGNKGKDPMVEQQWNMSKIGMGQVWTKTPNLGRRLVVAVLGSGVDYTHEDLAANIYVNRAEWKAQTPGHQNPVDRIDDDQNGYVDDFIGYDFVENDGLPFDRNGAGTAMAGIIGAVGDNGSGLKGILGDVSLLPVRFLDGSGTFFFPHLVQALEYARQAKVDLIVLHTPSYVFGAGASFLDENPDAVAEVERASFAQALQKVQVAGIPIVASAGNTGTMVDKKNSLLEELKKFNNVVVVTSVDQTDKRPFIANYSMRLVHTAAPGAQVLTTAPGNRYQMVSGTSVAAAHVAGALAIAMSEHFGRLTAQAMLSAFINPSASDAVDSMRFETMGGNRLNVDKYLNFLNR